MARRRKFTAKEKAAFNAGRGFAQAKKGRRVSNRTKAEKRSFLKGLKWGSRKRKSY